MKQAVQTLFAVLLSVVTGTSLCAVASGDDSQKIQGRWKVVKYVAAGDERTDVEGLEMVFENKDFTFLKDGLVVATGTFAVDARQSPNHIDMKIEGSPNAKEIGKTARGIFKFEKERLHWCAAKPGTDSRPARFSSGKNQQQVWVILQRVKETVEGSCL